MPTGQILLVPRDDRQQPNAPAAMFNRAQAVRLENVSPFVGCFESSLHAACDRPPNRYRRRTEFFPYDGCDGRADKRTTVELGGGKHQSDA